MLGCTNDLSVLCVSSGHSVAILCVQTKIQVRACVHTRARARVCVCAVGGEAALQHDSECSDSRV